MHFGAVLEHTRGDLEPKLWVLHDKLLLKSNKLHHLQGLSNPDRCCRQLDALAESVTQIKDEQASTLTCVKVTTHPASMLRTRLLLINTLLSILSWVSSSDPLHCT